MYRVRSGTFLAVGLPRPTRILARVDDGESYEFRGMCTGAACVLRGHIAGQLRQRLQSGEVLRLEFRSSDRAASVTEVSLAGFQQDASRGARSSEPLRPHMKVPSGSPLNKMRPTASKCASRAWICCDTVWMSRKRRSNGVPGKMADVPAAL